MTKSYKSRPMRSWPLITTDAAGFNRQLHIPTHATGSQAEIVRITDLTESNKAAQHEANRNVNGGDKEGKNYCESAEVFDVG